MIGLLKLTLRERYFLALAIVVLLITQSFLGTVITSWSIYLCVAVAPVLRSEKSEVTLVFTVTGMYGTHVLFQNLSGLKICQKCYKQAHKKSTRSLLFLWLLVGCNSLINLLILSVVIVKVSKHIVRSMRQSLEKGIHSYLKNPYWKHTIDKLQVKMKCCGVDSYSDWHELSWIDEHHINVDADAVKNLRTSKTKLHLPVVPWSCCRSDFPMQCFHDPLQQVESAYLWTEQPSVVLDSIYNRGCLILLKRPIEFAITGIVIIIVFILLLQIITILLSRILYTSCRNAILLGITRGKAPGWVIGRGDCGCARGPDLMEIMEGELNESTSRGNPKSSKSSGKVSFNLPRSSKSSHTRSNKSNSTPRSEEDPVSSGEEAALMLT